MAIKATFPDPCPDCGALESCCKTAKERLYTANQLTRLIERMKDGKSIKAIIDAASSAEIGLSNGKGSVPFIISMLHGALLDLGIDNRKEGKIE